SAARNAVARCDRVALGEAAHSLKGSVGNFGYAPAFDAALALERMAADAPTDELRRACGAIEREIAVLKGLLGRITAPAEADPAPAAPPVPGGSCG
ncbi:MAG TPA: Hpt domain-containing protein, partial [Gemmatimonadales bacterium]|nr:Hpt domain-containing protein [Gemmatimonadales bacterium]